MFLHLSKFFAWPEGFCYCSFHLQIVVDFSEAVSENGNLEDLFKQFASLMPLRGYKLLQVMFMKTFICQTCSVYR